MSLTEAGSGVKLSPKSQQWEGPVGSSVQSNVSAGCFVLKN